MSLRDNRNVSFLEKNNFYDVLCISDLVDSYQWLEISSKIVNLPKGWFEIMRFSPTERISFIKDFWILQLGIHNAVIINEIEAFFGSLENIAVYATKTTAKCSYSVKMVYEVKNSDVFFHGNPPININLIDSWKSKISSSLPDDYINFFKIHDGFSCSEDGGIYKLKDLSRVNQILHNNIIKEELMFMYKEFDWAGLFPFYEYNIPCEIQCFYQHNGNYTGINVLFSEDVVDLLPSALIDKDSNKNEVLMFHNSFSSWLVDYLKYNVL